MKGFHAVSLAVSHVRPTTNRAENLKAGTGRSDIIESSRTAAPGGF